MVLTHYDPEQPLGQTYDAFPVGIGAVLSHIMEDGSEWSIAFASRTLMKAEWNYSLALIWGVKKSHLYLSERHFTLVTDHEPLTTCFVFYPPPPPPQKKKKKKKRNSSKDSCLQHYEFFLAGFEYSIEYKSTTQPGNVHGLLRLPLEKTYSKKVTT